MSELAIHILQSELARRCSVNPRYSLRAFARLLSVSPANLSLVLNRKRPASRKLVGRLLERVEIDKRDRLALMGQEFSEVLPVQDSASIDELESTMNLVCYGILSLTVTHGFKSDLKWIASRLNVSVHEIRDAVDALVTAKLLDVSKPKWKQTTPLRLNNKISTASTRIFQRELIQRALIAMDELPVELRDLSSMTFAMSPDQVPKAKDEIRRFRLRMAKLFEEEHKSTDVYNLTVQLVPITKEKRK